jgi:hypothetical protein
MATIFKKFKRNQLKQAETWDCFILAIFFDPEDGGRNFVLNVVLSPRYTTLQIRRLYCTLHNLLPVSRLKFTLDSHKTKPVSLHARYFLPSIPNLVRIGWVVLETELRIYFIQFVERVFLYYYGERKKLKRGNIHHSIFLIKRIAYKLEYICKHSTVHSVTFSALTHFFVTLKLYSEFSRRRCDIVWGSDIAYEWERECNVIPGYFLSELVAKFSTWYRTLYLNAGFLWLSATVDHYMGGLRTGGPHDYYNIPLSHKEYAVALFFFSVNMRKIIKSTLSLSNALK